MIAHYDGRYRMSRSNPPINTLKFGPANPDANKKTIENSGDMRNDVFLTIYGFRLTTVKWTGKAI
jgi:hypothetical protein|tara:strand:+ start:387 stop:581 length:195 start_codon:yes stop_codon:yes gene_type:complete